MIPASINKLLIRINSLPNSFGSYSFFGLTDSTVFFRPAVVIVPAVIKYSRYSFNAWYASDIATFHISPSFSPIDFVAHIPAIHHATCKHLLTMFHHDVIINIMVDIEHMPSSTLHCIMRVYGFPESGFLSSSDSNSDNIFNDSSDDEDIVLKTGKWLHESITHILWLILVSRMTTNPSHLITQMTGYIRRSTWMTSPYDTPNTWTGLHSFGDIYKSNHYQLFLRPSVCEQAYVECCDRFSTFRTIFWTPLHKIDNWQNYYQMRMGSTYKESLTEATCLWLYSTSHNYFAWISGKQKTLPLRPNCLQRSIEFFQDVLIKYLVTGKFTSYDWV